MSISLSAGAIASGGTRGVWSGDRIVSRAFRLFDVGAHACARDEEEGYP